jgi:5-methylcytosine-specific restriction enzyme A
MSIVRHLIGVVQGKHPMSAKRSTKWTTVRKKFLEANPSCAVCKSNIKLEVHHKVPFHLNPELELDTNNLIVLCESNHNGINCHLAFGHLGNFKSLNPDVEQDAEIWNKKIANRKLGL